MSRDALMGIDLGTTAVKVGLFDAADGRELAVERVEYTPASPRPGWVELDADVYREATVEATRRALARADGARVIGIGLSSQGQTFVPLGEDLRPLRPAIVWLDTRAEEQAAWLREHLDPEQFRLRTGADAPNAIASAPKMLWIREHEPQVWARTRYLVMLPDWIGLLLTGRRRLDIHNAGSTHLVDHQAGGWWNEALAAVGVPREWLSPIGWPAEPVGEVTAEAARILGVPAGIPVALGSNDQLNGAVGVGNVRPGIASGTVGTAMAVITSYEMPEGQYASAHPVRGLAYKLCFAKCTGMLLTWLRDTLAPGESYEALLAEAVEVAPGCEGLTCLPHFSGTATPTFRSDVRGGFVGLTLGHGRGHLVRAVAEAV
ncbi:MAG TPA: FGGY family carbohydrate kinase, partial [Armatimonadota bacterium]|nr:FGGY family carbohydrate kinase [Armatimonadota bacterium]